MSKPPDVAPPSQTPPRIWGTWRDIVHALRWERDAVLAEQVGLLRRSFSATLVASYISALGTVWIMALVLPLAPMLWWLAAHTLTVAGVYAWLRPIPLPGSSAAANAWRLMACMVAMGLTWGSLGMVALRHGSDHEGVVYAIGILSTVSAGALGLGAPLFSAYLTYLSCTMGSVLVALALVGGPVTLPGCTLVAVYFLLTAHHARNLAQAARHSIELKFDNERLVAELRAESARAIQAQAQAEQANQAKSRFLAAASHDLRQPLHALGLFLDTLARSPLGPQQAEVLGHARTASAAAAEMLGTLLDYSRLEAGVVHARAAPFGVQTLLSMLEQEFGPQADASNLVYRTRETSAAAYADKALTGLVMRNLIANALRYTDSGGVLIACRKRGDRLALEVWDTGCGIAAEHLQAIFNEFHQLANPERDRRKGLGLGLAIVQRLADTMHTEVQVRSRPARGSVFRLYLPPWHQALPDEGPSLAAIPTERLHGLRLLVVDDDAAVRQGMEALLSSWGCQCLCVDSSTSALAALAHMPAPDVVITDFRLRHEETGKQVLQALQAQLGRALPAIIMTGDTSPQRLRDAQSADAVLLHKPVSTAQLQQTLLQWAPVHAPHTSTPAP